MLHLQYRMLHHELMLRKGPFLLPDPKVQRLRHLQPPLAGTLTEQECQRCH